MSPESGSGWDISFVQVQTSGISGWLMLPVHDVPSEEKGCEKLGRDDPGGAPCGTMHPTPTCF